MTTTFPVTAHSPSEGYSPSTTLCGSTPALFAPTIPAAPRLEVNSLDDTPFSENFTDYMDEKHLRRRSGVVVGSDMSYDLELFTNIKEIVPEWKDNDIDEIIVMSPKTHINLSSVLEDSSEMSAESKVASPTDFQIFRDAYTGRKPGVFLCKARTTGRVYTLKTLDPRSASGLNEIHILDAVSKLKQPFLPSISWSFREPELCHLIMGGVHKTTLEHMLTYQPSLCSVHALIYTSEIVSGISSLHSSGIIHRNLNPETVAIDTDGHILLTGFEHASRMPSSMVSPIQNADHSCPGHMSMTSEYTAPEVLLGWTYGYPVDCWSIGALLHRMLSGKGIFEHIPVGLPTCAYHGVFLTLDATLEAVALDLVSKCLERNSAFRLNIHDVRQHPYFAPVDWKRVSGKAQAHYWLGRNIGACYGLQELQFGTTHERPVSAEKVDSTKPDIVPLPAYPVAQPVEAVPVVERPQFLPKISTSPLLENIPELEEPTETSLVISDVSSHSTIQPKDAPPTTAIGLSEEIQEVIPAKDNLATFWEMLDAEEELRDHSSHPNGQHLRKNIFATGAGSLRKARSAVISSGRFSVIGTVTPTVQNKLKKLRPQGSFVASTLGDEKRGQDQLQPAPPILDLPNGIKQIGNGIGFTYSVPVAALSKASICTSTAPKVCQSILHQSGQHILGLGLKIGNVLSRMRSTSTLGFLSSGKRPADLPPSFGATCDSTLASSLSGPGRCDEVKSRQHNANNESSDWAMDVTSATRLHELRSVSEPNLAPQLATPSVLDELKGCHHKTSTPTLRLVTVSSSSLLSLPLLQDSVAVSYDRDATSDVSNLGIFL